MQCGDIVGKTSGKKLTPDVLTDQTSAHDPLIGYVPHTLSVEQANVLRKENPTEYIKLSYESMRRHVELMLALQQRGPSRLTMATTLGLEQKKMGWIMLLIFLALCLLIYARFSAKGRAHSDGRL